MQSPAFWYPGDRPSASDKAKRLVLAPAAFLYGLGARLRQRVTVPERVSIPVICIGNVTAGGAGKTPVAIAVAKRLTALGERPHFLSRGYGGTEAGPCRVDPDSHKAHQVGDEPLLLAAYGPAWVSRDRVAGALAAEQAGASVIVLDDGFQNPTLHKDMSLVVVDTEAGTGNGAVIPAGPLREPFARALERMSALVALGPVELAPSLDEAAAASAIPVLRARIEAAPNAASMIGGRPLVAYAGIGRPEKFFGTLTDLGATLLATRTFADHHGFSEADAEALLKLADEAGAALITTEKDAVRLKDLEGPAGQSLRVRSESLPVSAQFSDIGLLDGLLKSHLDAARASHTYAPPGTRSA